MTLVISAANADQVIQVSDRRLTAGATLVDDSSNKAGHAICDDASFLYSFTGIARAGSEHVTSRWMMTALHAAAQSSHRYRDIWDALAKEADAYFSTAEDLKKCTARERRLTMIFSGYTADGFIISALISNFQDFVAFVDHPEAREKFSVFAERSDTGASNNPTMIQVIGQFGALTSEDEKQIRRMLIARSPAEAIRQKLIALIQEISDRPQANGTVGKKINSARLSYLEPLTPVSGYASDKVENQIHLINTVDLRSGALDIMLADMTFTTTSPVVVPRVHRNAPCPCGSSKKYCLCHGKAGLRG